MYVCPLSTNWYTCFAMQLLCHGMHPLHLLGCIHLICFDTETLARLGIAGAMGGEWILNSRRPPGLSHCFPRVDAT